MAVTPWSDKIAIQAILTTDPYLSQYLGFEPDEIYTVKATDELLGLSDKDEQLKQQIFIYNAASESTINPIIYGIVYEVDVSVPTSKQGTADLAMQQILALLNDREISNTHKLEILDMPVVLASETSLYQIGCRFACYVSKYTAPKSYVPKPPDEPSKS